MRPSLGVSQYDENKVSPAKKAKRGKTDQIAEKYYQHSGELIEIP